MPGKVKVRILAARNLPVMDRSSDTTDAFAEVKLADVTFKTSVCQKTLNPCWNSDWFRFDVDDCDLQDEPLQIRIMDYDTYSANDAIGKVYIDLNPLLLKADSNRVSSDGQKQIMLSGWLPIFDTMHGVRGEVQVQVKVELFSDLNKFRTSSCGVLFFCSDVVPEGYSLKKMAFVEKLVINDDPEYQWIDKIRTPRASNEARQTLFMKLSSTVQRKIGLMALELGANAVLGYKQYFDMEGDTGIVVRGIGTAVTLVKQQAQPIPQEIPENKELLESNSGSAAATTNNNATLKSGNVAIAGGHGNSRHASGDSSPKVTSSSNATAASLSTTPFLSSNKLPSKTTMARDGPDILEYPFLTLRSFPEGFIQRLGGLVCCRSVKLLEGELEDNRTQRENWWQEIRQEIRSHARCLGCNIVVGYTEETSIWDDLVVLSASGTAVVGNLNFMLDLQSDGLFGPPYLPLGSRPTTASKSATVHEDNSICSLLHISMGETGLPFSWRVHKCHACGKQPVPDVMFTTIEPPVGQLGIAGRGCLLLAKVLRVKKDLKGESNAKEISDALPFIEYELHRQLLNKLKVKGMNAIFGLKISLSISDRIMIATALGTGVHLSGLAAPTPPRLVHHRDDKEYLHRMQRRLEEKIAENMTYHGISEESRRRSMSADDEEEFEYEGETAMIMDNSPILGNKEICVLEIDDTEDADILDSILDRFPPPGVQVFSTEELVGISLGHFVHCSQMFTQVWRGRIQPTTKDLTRICQRLLSSIYFKLRKLKPCLVSKLQINADIDDEHELQLSLTGMAIALAHGGKTREELAKELATIDGGGESDDTAEQKSPMPKLSKSTNFFVEAKAPEGIMLTPLKECPGAVLRCHLGLLNQFLIRETSSLREAGGLNSFVQTFICEIHAIMRAHVLALGGNALISYFMSELVIMHNPHKNQAQCVAHFGGDAVQVAYIAS